VYDAVLDKLNQGARWHRVRVSVLQGNPMCVGCEIEIAKEVDHKVPADIAIQQVRDSGRYPLDRYAGYYLKSNLRGMCRRCHALKTLEDKAHTGPWPDVLAIEDAAPKRRWTF
jgi:5-methylcytosine-specific restriction endonuclease McrA